jgi:hypothetical protein
MESTPFELKQQIILLHNEMKELTLKYIIKEQKYNSVILDLEEFTELELKELLEWLKGIKDKQYKELAYVYSLHTPEMWERFNKLKIKGRREQNMLSNAIQALRVLWEHPYRTAKQRDRIERRKGVNKHKL